MKCVLTTHPFLQPREEGKKPARLLKYCTMFHNRKQYDTSGQPANSTYYTRRFFKIAHIALQVHNFSERLTRAHTKITISKLTFTGLTAPLPSGYILLEPSSAKRRGGAKVQKNTQKYICDVFMLISLKTLTLSQLRKKTKKKTRFIKTPNYKRKKQTRTDTSRRPTAQQQSIYLKTSRPNYTAPKPQKKKRTRKQTYTRTRIIESDFFPSAKSEPCKMTIHGGGITHHHHHLAIICIISPPPQYPVTCSDQ